MNHPVDTAALCSLLGLWDFQLRCHHPVCVHPRHRPQADDHSQPTSPHRHQEVHCQRAWPAGTHPSHAHRHPEASASSGFLHYSLHTQPPDLQRPGEDGAAQPSLPAARPAAHALWQPGAWPALCSPTGPPARCPAVWLTTAPWARLRLCPTACPSFRAQLWLCTSAKPLPGPVLRRIWREEWL